MTNTEFEKSMSEQLDFCKSLLITKGEEYAQDNVDRLQAFKKAAAVQGISTKEALAGMMVKHTISIYDMCGDSKKKYPVEKWKEKITDHINYLLLLKAVIDEEENLK